MGNQELLDLMVLFEDNKIELYNDEDIYINFENLSEFVDIFSSDELDESPFNCRLDLGRVSVKLSDVCFTLGIKEGEIIKRLSDV